MADVGRGEKATGKGWQGRRGGPEEPKRLEGNKDDVGNKYRTQRVQSDHGAIWQEWDPGARDPQSGEFGHVDRFSDKDVEGARRWRNGIWEGSSGIIAVEINQESK